MKSTIGRLLLFASAISVGKHTVHRRMRMRRMRMRRRMRIRRIRKIQRRRKIERRKIGDVPGGGPEEEEVEDEDEDDDKEVSRSNRVHSTF